MSSNRTSRALRRHHRARLIKRAFDKLIHWDYQWELFSTPKDEVLSECYDRAVRMHKHMAQCSCATCGNPRKHFKELTMQELKKAADYKDQMCELDNIDSIEDN